MCIFSLNSIIGFFFRKDILENCLFMCGVGWFFDFMVMYSMFFGLDFVM